MAMREDCRHFQSRTYSSGDAARFCVLNLAPEAPWRCPEGCPRYQHDLIDATFVVGSLVRTPLPDGPPANTDVAGVLDAADLIVTAAGPEIVAEVRRQQGSRPWWKVWRRKESGGYNLSTR